MNWKQLFLKCVTILKCLIKVLLRNSLSALQRFHQGYEEETAEEAEIPTWTVYCQEKNRFWKLRPFWWVQEKRIMLSQYIYNDCSPIQEGSLFRVFMAVSLCRCDWLNHLPGAWAQSPAPLSSLEAKGGGWKCQPSIHLVGFPDEQPSPHSETTQGPALSHLISINQVWLKEAPYDKDIIQEIRSFWSSMPRG